MFFMVLRQRLLRRTKLPIEPTATAVYNLCVMMGNISV